MALHRGQQYDGMDSIQAELSARVMELAPAGMPAQQQVRALAAAFTSVWLSRTSSWESRGCLGRSWDTGMTLVCSGWRACNCELSGQESRSFAPGSERKVSGCPFWDPRSVSVWGLSDSTETAWRRRCLPCRLQLFILPVAETGCLVPHFCTGLPWPFCFLEPSLSEGSMRKGQTGSA